MRGDSERAASAVRRHIKSTKRTVLATHRLNVRIAATTTELKNGALILRRRASAVSKDGRER
jgi:hypothetical protein